MVKQDPLELFDIREARESDIEAILEIYNERILNSTSLFMYEPVTLENRLNWFHDTRSKGFPLIVAVEKATGTPIAYASYSAFRVQPSFKLTVETSLYIHQNFHRKGLGRLLLGELVRIAKEMNIRVLIGGITSENAPSISLFKSFGFELAGEFRDSGYKFGRFLNVSFYQLVLDTMPKVVDGIPYYKPFPWGSYRFGEPL